MHKITKSTRRSITIILVLAMILSATAGMVSAKYVEGKNVASGISLTVEREYEYTINKAKMQSALASLSSNITELKFVTGSEVEGLTATSENLQADNSGQINLYVDGTTAYIAPADTEDSTSVIYATDCGQFFSTEKCGNITSSLTDINLENLDTSKTDTMWCMFYNCSSLKNLTFGEGFDTSNVTMMAQMFLNCASLTELDLSKFNTEKVTGMGNMFNSCSNLKKLNLSSFNTNNVQDMRKMFEACKTLAEVRLGKDFVFKSSTDGTQTYNGYLPAQSSDNITGADGKWYIQNNATADGMTPEDLATYHNEQGKTITYVAVPPTNYVISKSNMQSALNGLSTQPTTLKFVKGSDVAGLTATATGLEDSNKSDGAINLYLDGTTAYIAPADSTDSTNIIKAPSDSSYFLYGGYGNLGSSLTSLDLSNLDTSDVTTMYGMFMSLSALKSIEFDSFDTSKVQYMNFMFSNCNALTALDLSGFDTSKVTNMAYMFYNCNSLETLDIGTFDTSNVTNMELMFNNCYKVKALDIGNFNTGKVTKMWHMFDGCHTITSLEFGSGFTTSKVTDMSCMFYDCYKLTSLNLENFDTNSISSGGVIYMFSSCYDLESIKFGSGFTISNVTSIDYMFNNCYKLSSLNLENFDTSSVITMEKLFYKCYALSSLDLTSFDTSKVTGMNNMFAYCTGLSEVTLGANFKFNYASGNLPVPDSTVIEGADGSWYIKDGDGTAMTPAEVATYQQSAADTVSYVAVKPKSSAENAANSADVSDEITDGTVTDSTTEEQVQGVQTQSDAGLESQDTENVTVHAQ